MGLRVPAKLLPHRFSRRRFERWSLLVFQAANLAGCVTEPAESRTDPLISGAPVPTVPNTPIDPGGAAGRDETERSDVTPEPNAPDVASSVNLGTSTPPADPEARVSGGVIDFWGHPVPDVTVLIEGQEVNTNPDGKFALENVPPVYDVFLAVRILGEVNETYGYKFEGLTRRDPLLQLYKGLPQHTTPFIIRAPGLSGRSGWQGELALGGQHGQRSYPLNDMSETVAGWRGPEEVTAPLRVLVWQTEEHDSTVPSAFLYAESSELALTDGLPAEAAVNLPEEPSPLASTQVRLTASRVPRDSYLVASYLRASSGPAIKIAQVARLATDPEPYVTLVPVLEGASVTLAGIIGNGALHTPFAVTYEHHILPEGLAEVTFPTITELTAPEDTALDVTFETPFTWTDTAGTYLVSFEDLGVYQTVFVVTSTPQTTLPDLRQLGIYYAHEGTYRWSVESHGRATSVDELCSAPGYLDPFAGDFEHPMGPRDGGGEFWRSETRLFEFR